MRAILSAIILALGLTTPTQAQQGDGLKAVMAAVRADDWRVARVLARPQGGIMRDIVEWRYLRAGLGDFGAFLDFLVRNPDWPGLDRIWVHGETAITGDVDPQTILDFFAGREPSSGNGGYRLSEAHRKLGNPGEADAQLALTWLTAPLDDALQLRILSGHADVVSGLHVARLDAMLWRGAEDDAERMFALVPEGWVKLAQARIALRALAPGVDTRIEAVPDALRDDPGLNYERFLWRLRKGRDADAIALLDSLSVSAEALGQPARWAGRRAGLARELIREGRSELAYRLAANHFMSGGGATYADLEWLSGFIALRQLNEPEVALSHFQRFEAAVKTPISLGRAGYWQGRAFEAMGQSEAAQAAYAKGGAHQSSFYGQLAAEKAGLSFDPALLGGQVLPDWRAASFANSEVFQAAQMFLQAGERNLAEWFLTHLAETSPQTEQTQLARFALEADEPHIALRLAKTVAGNGVVLPDAYYPITDLADLDHPVSDALVLSIARRESEFDPGVTSGAGARGLMQVMPGTAREMAGDLNIPYSQSRLLSDPDYNARIGAEYLSQLTDEFGGNVILIAAAYNAGPSRPLRWMRERGDPRSARVDVIDWIEMIPFNETRNYVMRVAETVPIYRARLSGRAQPMQLSKDIIR